MFNLYSGFLKDITIENNTITGPGNKLGLFTYNATIRNNTLSTSFRTFGVAGDIIIENNKNFDPNNFNPIYSLESGIGNSIHPDYLSYEQVKEIGVNFKFNNNEDIKLFKIDDDYIDIIKPVYQQTLQILKI